MTQQYLDIWFDRIPDLKCYTTVRGEKASQVIAGLGHLNLFIGPNNAGKSRFMRALFGQAAFDCLPSDFRIQDLRALLVAVQGCLDAHLGQSIVSVGGIERGTVTSLAQTKDDVIRKDDPGWEDIPKKLESFLQSNGPYSPTFRGSFAPGQAETENVVTAIKKPVSEFLNVFNANKIQVGKEPHTYIPILRGLREFDGSESPYRERTQKDYGSAWPEKRGDIFTGEGLYDRLKELLLGDRAKRELVRKYESFLSKEFFQGRNIELVPRQDSDVVHLVIGGKQEKAIYDLGDGLQSIIVLTFPIFTSEERRLFFIEEPEVHLHPGMQRRLIEVLRLEAFEKHQFFLTTHSNHLLDIVAEDPATSVYLFRPTQEDQNEFTITRIQRKDRQVLQSLGARSSAMYLTNAVIWVEGITDRLYLRAFLRRYLARRATSEATVLKEDTHYVFAEVGGACVVHWNFDEDGEALAKEISAARICGENFLVLDGDNANKGRRKETFELQLGDKFYLLQAKEIENLLPADAVKAAVKNRFPNVPPDALAKIDEADYQKSPKGLGEYLKEVTGCNLMEKSGTVAQKMDFCVAAIDEMGKSNEWELADDAESLCKKLVDFIRSANQMTPEKQC